MYSIRIIIIILLTSTLKVFAQTIEFRPSIGWGHGWGTNNKINTNLLPINYKVAFYNPSLSAEVPQLGLMFEYNYYQKWIISIGRMHGKTELYNSINGSVSITQSLIQKFGTEFYYRINKLSSHSSFYIYAGLYYANNTNTDYNAGNIQFATLDSLGIVKTRNYDTALNIYKNGNILSSGLRITIFNPKKNRESISITLNYDMGLKPLWTNKTTNESNYLLDYISASSTSKGSQLKIYLSKPIKIYKYKKGS
jgi:hypothetical protein